MNVCLILYKFLSCIYIYIYYIWDLKDLNLYKKIIIKIKLFNSWFTLKSLKNLIKNNQEYIIHLYYIIL